MKHMHSCLTAVLLLAGFFMTGAFAAPGDFSDKIGRPVKVAAAAIGCGGDYEKKLPLAIEHLHAAGAAGADIVCLPEEFSGGASEPVPGPTTDTVAALAKQYGMYVICPLKEHFEDKEYNTAVLIDREGNLAGCYRKIFVFWSENVHAGEARVPWFDTDFGRISILICFDINFPELWLEAARNGSEIVFWPSAFGGGFPLNGYAGTNACYVVSVGDGDFIDMTGGDIAPDVTPMDGLHIATLDLDRTLVHKDYTRAKVDALLAAHGEEIVLEKDWHPEGWLMLRALKPGVRVRDLCRRHDIETLQEYRLRSREQINARRAAGVRIGADRNGIPTGMAPFSGVPGKEEVPAWIRAFSGRLIDAWRRGHPLPQLSAVHPEATLADAYAIQRQLVLGSGIFGAAGGFKAAGVGGLVEDDYPPVAVIPAAGVFSSTDTIVIDLRDGPPRHVETEIGYRIGKPILEPPGSIEELRAYVDAVMAVIEVPGNPVASFQPGTREDLVAWNINGKEMITGDPHDPSEIDPDAVEIAFTRDEETINTARGDMAALGQWPTLLKTVNQILQQGYTIGAGHVISNGALGKIVKAMPGAYRADFGPLGSIAFDAR
ncbi:MAG: Aliphatic amidase [Candidatus Hydrogenedentes bacterium ADurb.Bin101]|nr:MAG: Aliphatic amidase [Candidatus Hydrogenedentes bacterium ADurb.Bin101]HOC67389.1 nitrilase-related carbon-nitrogen hydrolase [Candidatus Hydrogenedentota bacterium]